MKRSLLALAALTAFAGVASAQSSVTIFGILDVNARNVKNGSQSIKSLSNDGNATSRLGFRGVEDLGGGLRAGFWLEAQLGPDTGTMGGSNAVTTATWNRRATVSLLGGFGEIRLGRDYTPTFWNHTTFDPFGTNGVGASTNLVGDGPFGTAQTRARANNTIGYFLPSGLGGLYGQVMVAAGENQVPGNKYVGGRVGYAAGPLNIAVAYGKTERAGTMIDDMTGFNVGGSWNIGFMTLMGMVHRYEEGPRQLDNWLIGGIVPFGASSIKFSYQETERTSRFSGTNIDLAGAPYSKRKAKQAAVGYLYDLSKRTTLYAHAARIGQNAGLTYTTSGSGPAIGTNGQRSTGYEFGIRHSF